MKKYKFITIEEDGDHNGHPLYRIVNNKHEGLLGGLGNIFWYPPWKRYVLNSTFKAVYDSNCLRDIINFIEDEIPKATA